MNKIINRIRKKTYNYFIRTFKLELFLYGPHDQMFMCIDNIKSNGFYPETILDIGAYEGNWTKAVIDIYPESKIYMIEAQPGKTPMLEKIKMMRSENIEYSIALVGEKKLEKVPYYLMETGSSVLAENTDYKREKIELEMTTVDDLLSHTAMNSPVFVKIDVQGLELAVMKGAEKILNKAELVLLEVSTVEYNQGAPLFSEIISYMNEKGFVVYDIVNTKRTNSKHILFQMDVFFCRKDSQIRSVDSFS